MSSAPFNGISGHHEHPVKGVSSAFAILFAICGVAHIYQNTKHRCWPMFWLLPFISIIFTAGFICSEYNAFHPASPAPTEGLLFSAVPILLASLFISLFHLMDTHPGFHRLWASAIYVIVVLLFSAVISLTAQGTANYFNPDASPKTVRACLAILKASLVILLFFNVCFLAATGFVHRHCAKSESFQRGAKTLAYVLYASGVLMLVRNIYRTVQIFSSPLSSAWTSEAFFWVFDASPMLICMILLVVLYPGRLVPFVKRNGPRCVSDERHEIVV